MFVYKTNLENTKFHLTPPPTQRTETKTQHEGRAATYLQNLHVIRTRRRVNDNIKRLAPTLVPRRRNEDINSFTARRPTLHVVNLHAIPSRQGSLTRGLC